MSVRSLVTKVASTKAQWAALGVVGALVPLQVWVGGKLANGDFGPTPAWAVFVPWMLWLVAAIASIGLLVLACALRLRSAHIVLVALTAILCLTGAIVAADNVTGFLQVW